MKSFLPRRELLVLTVFLLLASAAACQQHGKASDIASDLADHLTDALDFDGGEIEGGEKPAGSEAADAPQIVEIDIEGELTLGQTFTLALSSSFSDFQKVDKAILHVVGATKYIVVTGALSRLVEADRFMDLFGRLGVNNDLRGKSFTVEYALQTSDGKTGAYQTRVLKIADTDAIVLPEEAVAFDDGQDVLETPAPAGGAGDDRPQIQRVVAPAELYPGQTFAIDLYTDYSDLQGLASIIVTLPGAAFHREVAIAIKPSVPTDPVLLTGKLRDSGVEPGQTIVYKIALTNTDGKVGLYRAWALLVVEPPVIDGDAEPEIEEEEIEEAEIEENEVEETTDGDTEVEAMVCTPPSDDPGTPGDECCDSTGQWAPIDTPCADDGVTCTNDVCSADHKCAHQVKVDACLILAGEVPTCFASEGLSPDNECLICNPTKNPNDWSPVDGGVACTTFDPLGACYSQYACNGAGSCAGKGEPYSCDTGNPCKQGFCDPFESLNGCRFEYPTDVSCEDGSSCTTGDFCSDGACIPGSNVEDCTACDDGLAETIDDSCRRGICKGLAKGDPFTCTGPCPAQPPGAASGVMVKIPGTTLCIDVFETTVSTDPTCQGAYLGQSSDNYGACLMTDGSIDIACTTPPVPCSMPGILSSGYLTWERANAVCSMGNKQLCSVANWTKSCQGGNADSVYPYGPAYDAMTCNGADYSFPNNPVPLPNGALPGCLSGYGVFDMSGNRKEWLSDFAAGVGYALAGGSSNSSGGAELTCTSAPYTPSVGPAPSADRGTRCCFNANPIP